ncbi:MAG: bifunctional riboflavin kinase/FAD synthetase [Lachnospiraceae bacterium]
MMIIQNPEQFYIQEPTAVTIGKFDGVHLGHRKLLQEVMAYGSKGWKTVVFTFCPSPAVFFGYADNRKITTDEERRLMLEKIGIDYLVEFRMNQKNAGIPAQNFMEEYLMNRLNAKVVVAGPDLSFGYRGQGNVTLLQTWAKPRGIDVKIIDKICQDGAEISSSRIRRLLENGEMEKAKKQLGCDYGICGEVLHGAHLGTGMSIPTVNLCIPKDKVLPPYGVYYSKVFLEKDGNRSFYGISNLGIKPTVKSTAEINLETYLYQFRGDLYGKQIRVELLHYVRPEQKFSSLEELEAQLQSDKAGGAEYFGIER